MLRTMTKIERKKQINIIKPYNKIINEERGEHRKIFDF